MQDVERSIGDELAVCDTAGEDLGAGAKRQSPRRWTEEEKARIVRESFWPGNQVGEVARRYGVNPRRLSEWRGLARQGKLAVPSSPASAEPGAGPAFAALEVEDAPESASTPSASTAPVSIEASGVTVRIGGDSGVARIAEIAAALRGLR
jgi:transposase